MNFDIRERLSCTLGDVSRVVRGASVQNLMELLAELFVENECYSVVGSDT